MSAPPDAPRLTTPASLPGILLLAGAAVLVLAETVRAATTSGAWISDVLRQVGDPWFWFGIGAQTLFFFRFFWQWLVSEKRKRSTIPISFWYFSLAGGISLFVYAAKRKDLVIMLGQLLSCVIYIRNLMLIYGRANRRRQAGLPAGTSVVAGQDDAPEEQA